MISIVPTTEELTSLRDLAVGVPGGTEMLESILENIAGHTVLVLPFTVFVGVVVESRDGETYSATYLRMCKEHYGARAQVNIEVGTECADKFLDRVLGKSNA